MAGPFRGWMLLLCAGFAGVQGFTAWNWGTPSPTSWAVDSVGGPEIVDWVRNGMRYEGFEGRYPPVHRYILAAACAPAVGLFKISAHSTGESPSPIERLNRDTTLIRIGRLVSILMALGTMVLLFRLGEGLGRCGAGFLAAGIWTGGYLTAYYSVTSNLDVPYVFWSLLAIERVVAFQRRGDALALAVSAVSAALAVGTKDQAAGLIVAVPILLLWRHPVSDEHGIAPHRNSDWKPVWRWSAIAAGVYLVLSQALLRPGNYLEHLRLVFGPGLEYQTGLGLSQQAQAYAGHALNAGHPLFLLSVAAGTVAAAIRNGRLALWILTPALVYTLVFVLASGLLAARFLLPQLTLLALVAGLGLAGFGSVRSRMRSALVVTTGFAIWASGFSMTFSMWHDPRAQADASLARLPAATRSLATHGLIRAYLPTLALIHARVVPPEHKLPTPTDAEYLVVPEHGVLDRMMAPRAGESAQVWRDLIDGRLGYRVVERVDPRPPPFPWQPNAAKRLHMKGLDQTIYILRRE